MSDAWAGLAAQAHVSELVGPAPRELRDALEPLPDATKRFAPRRLDAFVRGRAAAKLALRAIGADAAGALEIGPRGAPIWPPGVVGSLTHDEGVAAAAVARAVDLRGVGIDVQRVTREAGGTVALVARPAELALVPHAEGARFTVVFAAKESLYKCLAPTVGAFFGFEDALVVAAESSFVRLRLERALAPSLPRGALFDVRVSVEDAWARALLEWPASASVEDAR